MRRRKFLAVAATTIGVAGATYYLTSDKKILREKMVNKMLRKSLP